MAGERVLAELKVQYLLVVRVELELHFQHMHIRLLNQQYLFLKNQPLVLQ